MCGTVLARQQPPTALVESGIARGDASITGRVIDRQSARPLEAVVITLETGNRKRKLVALTDAAGVYAFDGIAAAEYRVSASFGDYVTQVFGISDGVMRGPRDDLIVVERGQSRRGVDFALVRGGSLMGRVTNHDGNPLTNAQIVLTRRMDASSYQTVALPWRTNARGEFVAPRLHEGQYVVGATWSDPDSPRGGALGSLRAYFPGVENMRDATTITLGVGEIVRGVDIVMPLSQLPSIKGTFVRSAGSGHIDAYVLDSGNAVKTVIVDAEGHFSTPRLPAGRYTLVARAEANDSFEAVMLTADLTVDLHDIVLGLLPTSSVTGRVATDDGTAVPSSIQIAAALIESEKEIDPYRRDRTYIGDDGVFELRGLFGQRRIQLAGFTDGWRIERVSIGKTPVAVIALEPGTDVQNVLVVLTRR
jgi:hypothetical protein